MQDADHYRSAIRLNPGDASLHFGLSLALDRVGDHSGAFAAARRAHHLDPANRDYLRLVANLLPKQGFATADQSLLNDLLSVATAPDTELRFVIGQMLAALKLQPKISRLMLQARSQGRLDFASASSTLASFPLLLRLMESIPLANLGLEGLLVVLRRSMLDALDVPVAGMTVANALALQCFANEYVYPESFDEEEAVERLAAAVRDRVGAGNPPPPLWIATLGAYRALGEFPWALRVPREIWPAEVRAVIVRQILEPTEEKELRDRIPRLTAIDDRISRAVRDQYEANPYPRWIRVAKPERPLSLDNFVRGWCSNPGLRDHRFPAQPEILIAGCGTGRQAILAAMHYENARILAIDLSLSSIAYASRKTREAGLRNIEYGQADILRIGELGRTFDYIESIGVLHHMDDPQAGLKALASILRPGGIMRLAFYSEAQRGPWFTKVRRLAAERGLPETIDDIRSFRQLIISMAERDADLERITHSENFYGTSDCRDLLFHVNEHQFDVARIAKALDAGGLRFLGFDERINSRALDRFRERYPAPDAAASLALWQDFERQEQADISLLFLCQKPFSTA